ncbi:DNA-directed RNA polymerases I, II, and III subunit RPABC1 [Pleurostoma richardsiae]|uniref:DNA-directed RNA polymerases I, II, and III subunit RPABC1 n=1 Tax=Pleurostoma richardsiae TaxID=41990 RepID=A0AA38R4T8_9PEZI|nr:DNA-directed RNA polymerases I, II, and III subunit RPABC1 [Pleurostoma richardsiae]
MDDDSGSGNREGNEREVVQFWRAWKTVHEMVADRGYELAEDEVAISLDRFKLEYTNPDGTVNRGKLQFSARPGDNMIRKFTPPATPSNPDPQPECGTIWVEFMQDNAIGVKEIKKFVQHCAANSFKSGIMVTYGALSPQARKVINATQQYTQIECFMREDLLVNITHHELVPTHVLLSKEEKAALLQRYRLKETQLPRLLQKDPVARYLGLRRGQVVKIIRKSETAGRYASYRLCV